MKHPAARTTQPLLFFFQALGVGVFDDVSLLVRAVRLVIVAVGPQHARQVGTNLVSVPPAWTCEQLGRCIQRAVGRNCNSLKIHLPCPALLSAQLGCGSPLFRSPPPRLNYPLP